MARGYANSELIPALVTQLETITIPAGDNETVAKVERWDAFKRDTSSLVHITVRTSSSNYANSGNDWLISRTFELACVVSQDTDLAKTTDEVLGDVAFDVVKALGEIDQDSTNDAYKASMQPPSVRWFQNDDPDILEVGVSVDVTFSWTEDKTDGSITGPGV